MKLFQEKEAWALFKVTAIGEASGWALLLYGIAARYYHLPGAVFMLPIGGSIHGLLFFAYLGVILAGFTSLNWRWPKAVFAICMSVIPFATWVFEAWCAEKRRIESLGSYRRILIKPLINHGDEFLVVQPSTGLDWIVPGDFASRNETPEQAAERVTKSLTGIRPVINQPPIIDATGRNEIIFYFKVENSAKYQLNRVSTSLKGAVAVDEIRFVSGAEVPELAPLMKNSAFPPTYGFGVQTQ